MAKIGPTFPAELTAAGVPLDGISWDSDAGIITACPDAMRSQVLSVLAAHDPTRTGAPPLPQQVPMWAAQAALKEAGKYDDINKFIVGDLSANPPIPSLESSNPPVFFAWTMGNYASRQSTFIHTLASKFNMSDADIDTVFVEADRIAQVAG